ncbi:hypothetical protein CapIbe_013306 [Capra ibex]
MGLMGDQIVQVKDRWLAPHFRPGASCSPRVHAEGSTRRAPRGWLLPEFPPLFWQLLLPPPLRRSGAAKVSVEVALSEVLKPPSAHPSSAPTGPPARGRQGPEPQGFGPRVCRMEPGALNFPTAEPLEEPKAALGRGLAKGLLGPPL